MIERNRKGDGWVWRYGAEVLPADFFDAHAAWAIAPDLADSRYVLHEMTNVVRLRLGVNDLVPWGSLFAGHRCRPRRLRVAFVVSDRVCRRFAERYREHFESAGLDWTFASFPSEQSARRWVVEGGGDPVPGSP
jgi:hypothetical protein